MEARLAVFPILFVLLIAAAMLFAITIAIVSMVKAGKTTGAVVSLITLLLCGVFMVGLVVPWIYVRQARSVASQETATRIRDIEAATQQWEMRHLESAPLPDPVPYQHEEGAHAIIDGKGSTTHPDAEVQTEDEVSSALQDAAIGEASATHSGEGTQTPDYGPRPKWVDAPMEGISMASGRYRKTLVIDRYHTETELYDLLPGQVTRAIRKYAEEDLDLPNARQVLQLPPGYAIDKDILVDRWTEVHEDSSVGRMLSLHVLLEFNDRTREDLRSLYAEAVVAHRLGAVGLGGGVLLSLLATLYGYLRLDTLTKGYYTRRLKLAAAAAAVGAVGVAGGLVAQGLISWA